MGSHSSVHLVFLCSFMAVTFISVQPAHIRVALYNSIPDLNQDQLNSYKEMVESEFRYYCSDEHQVEVVVDSDVYDPYADDLGQYFQEFDLIEIDALTLDQLVQTNSSLVVSLDEMNMREKIVDEIFPAAIDAMTVGDKIYGYPTLACGNFLTSIRQVSKCPINAGTAPMSKYKRALETCEKSFIGNQSDHYTTLVIGKMTDTWGWYLPYIYLDGYIDMYGMTSLQDGINELMAETVDENVCEELRWFIDLCKNHDTGEIRCENPLLNTSDIVNSIANGDSVLM